MTDRCPKCGASLVMPSVQGLPRYKCGSFEKAVYEGAGFFESNRCLRNQIAIAVNEICELKIMIDDLETEIQDQKQIIRWLENAIKEFAVPHMKLDDEDTPGDEYDRLMREWTDAVYRLVEIYNTLASGPEEKRI